MSISDKRKEWLLAGSYTRLLEEHEAAIARLYSCFSCIFPGSSRFWADLAEEEYGHRQLVISLSERINRGELTFVRPEFRYTALTESIERIQTALLRFETTGVSMREALEMSLKIENGMLETGFFEILAEDAPEVKKLLDNLAKNTEKHKGKVEREAGRLKWKVAGSKIVRPPEKKEGESKCTDLKAAVKAAQGNILESLITIEEAAGSLYRTYGWRLKDSAEFWNKMADEESEHAQTLRRLYEVLEQGVLFSNLGQFKKDILEEQVDEILEAEIEARTGSLTIHKALNMALQIEGMLTESKFYENIHSDSPEFIEISKQLHSESEIHADELQEEVGRALDLGPEAMAEVPLPSE